LIFENASVANRHSCYLICSSKQHDEDNTRVCVPQQSAVTSGLNGTKAAADLFSRGLLKFSEAKHCSLFKRPIRFLAQAKLIVLSLFPQRFSQLACGVEERSV